MLQAFLKERELPFNVLPTMIENLDREFIARQPGNALFEKGKGSLGGDEKAGVVELSNHLSPVQGGVHFGDDSQEIVDVPAMCL